MKNNLEKTHSDRRRSLTCRRTQTLPNTNVVATNKHITGHRRPLLPTAADDIVIGSCVSARAPDSFLNRSPKPYGGRRVHAPLYPSATYSTTTTLDRLICPDSPSTLTRLLPDDPPVRYGDFHVRKLLLLHMYPDEFIRSKIDRTILQRSWGILSICLHFITTSW